MLITNDFVFKENLLIQSLKFTFYLIRARKSVFFSKFQSWYILFCFILSLYLSS